MRKPCCSQYRQDMNKGAWSEQEDQKLVEYIREHGEGCWRSLPKAAGLLRCGKSCRLRWINYLRPDVKRGNFGEDEEDLIVKLHALLGNRWSLIAGRLPGRTDNEIKNYWNSHLKKKLKSMGIDPNNHRATLQLYQTSRSAWNTATLPTCHSSRVNQRNERKHDICYQQIYSKTDCDVGDDQLSDAGSCLQDNDSCRLPDLNLDLTISMASNSAEPVGSSSGLISNGTLILFQ